MPRHLIPTPHGTKLHIRTHNEFPPIPDRRFDWTATCDDYEPGSPIGYGATEIEAIADLIERIVELEEAA